MYQPPLVEEPGPAQGGTGQGGGGGQQEEDGELRLEHLLDARLPSVSSRIPDRPAAAVVMVS